MTEANPTTTTSPTTTQDPAEIERDIRRTQDQMSRTVDRLGDQLTPRNLLNALFDKAEDNNIDARYLLDGARRNPIALAMIAGGAIWLISDSDAKLPKIGGKSSSPGSSDGHHDPFHRDYVAHMERCQRDEAEDDLAYQRRRDLARANYFMLERGHEEDESSFRQRLDDAAEKFREKRRAWADGTRQAGSSLLDSTRQAGTSLRDSGGAGLSSARQAYSSNPLIGGLLAAAVGAIAGTVVPLTRVEEEQLSGAGEKAREAIGEQKDHLVSAARDKKDELVAKVEEQAQPSGVSGQTLNAAQAGEGQSRTSANDGEHAPRQLAAEETSGAQQSEWRPGNQEG